MSDSQQISSPPRHGRAYAEFALAFLGSMNLAIVILVVVAIASVIGTVLQQNQPYQDYIIKFGPFWHEVFRTLGLYNVYGAWWFLLLLFFLVLSTSVCIYRNGPTMLRDMRHFRLKVQEKSLRGMHSTRGWSFQQSADQTRAYFVALLSDQGYRLRQRETDEGLLIAGMKGGLNRLGYLFTHIGIVVICIGALLDSNIGLNIRESLGYLKLEKRDILASEVPPISRLKPNDILSFRGSVTLPENTSTNLVFLNVRDGYLVQELPFAVELKDFRIQHYESGQPKSFESDIVIQDDQLKQPLAQTIAVNHPLTYRGYSIYQASFSDGGSRLELKAWPFFQPTDKPLTLKGQVNQDRQVSTSKGEMNIEFSNFKLYNIFPNDENDPPGKMFKNFGPSIEFKVRDPSGQAHEYVNYMSPVMQEGRLFYLSGMRSEAGGQFRYLHIPADSKGGIERFMHFHALLNNPLLVESIARHAIDGSLGKGLVDAKMRDTVRHSMVHLVDMYTHGGFAAVDAEIRAKVPTEKQAEVAEAYVKVLRNMLQGVYVELLKQEGVKLGKKNLSLFDQAYFEDAVNNLAGIGSYGAPFYLQLVNFQQVEASGLQITRSPGKNVVYLGSALLIMGVFMLFYIVHQRLWVLIRPQGGKSDVVFAGSGNRSPEDFAHMFDALCERIEARLPRA